MAFAPWLISMATPLVRKGLAALGLGVVTYTGVSFALDQALAAAKSAWNSQAFSSAADLLAMAGANTALGILAGALVARITMQVLKRFEVL